MSDPTTWSCEVQTVNIILRRGDVWEPGTITVTMSGVVDFTGWEAKINVRSTTPGGTLIKTLTSNPAAGITLSSLGVITLSMADTETALFVPGDYVYDLQMTPPSGKDVTYMQGYFTVEPDYTYT